MERKAAYVIPPTHWPIIGCLGLVCIVLGVVNWLHGADYGPYLFGLGVLTLFYMAYRWFGQVIAENATTLRGNKLINHGFRMGMMWFIFTEVMFFVTFFGTLFYLRIISVPFLGGVYDDSSVMTHYVLWPDFFAHWPLLQAPNPALVTAPKEVMGPWGVPAINTLILLTSGVTLTIAHWGIIANKRMQTIWGQVATILLGMSFLYLQAEEYMEAYMHKGLRFDAGVYGNTFFILTGFHGLHVTLGTLMLCVILFRILRRDFDSKNHFAFEAVSWYWHFVDVVWLLLFVLVYWL